MNASSTTVRVFLPSPSISISPSTSTQSSLALTCQDEIDDSNSNSNSNIKGDNDPYPQSYIDFSVEGRETTLHFKERVLHELRRRGMFLHITLSGAHPEVFRLIDKRTGRALLEETPLLRNIALFDDSVDPPELMVVLMSDSKRNVQPAWIPSRARQTVSDNSQPKASVVPASVPFKPPRPPGPAPPWAKVQARTAASQTQRSLNGSEHLPSASNTLVDNTQHHGRVRSQTQATNLRDAFPDESYEVVKINIRGRRQKRLLKLTGVGIQNVRPSTMKVTANHRYSDIFSVTMRDQDTFVISFIDNMELIYCSPIAMQIVQELNRRIALRRHTEKVRTYSLVNSASATSKRFSPNLGTASASSAVSSNQEDANDENEEVETLPEEDLNLLLEGMDIPAIVRISRPIQKPTGIQTPKLEFLTGATRDMRVAETIDRILLDPLSEEGRARNRFLRNFNALERKPSLLLDTMREFIDSLRQFMEVKHGQELLRLTGKTDVKRETTDSSEVAASSTDTLVTLEISQMIERSLEQALVTPVYLRIVKALAPTTQARDDVIQRKIKLLSTKDQKHFGTLPQHVSTTNWIAAQYEMSCMEKKATPAEKLDCLLHTARSIYNTYNYERNIYHRSVPLPEDVIHRGNRPHFYLAADEFFPIFVFVVVRSAVSHHEFQKQFMWGLCDRSSLSGEGGYYLTVYEAALEFIHATDETAIDMHLPQDPVQDG